MNLRTWVNDKEAMEEFNEFLQERIAAQHRRLEQASDLQEMYQAQGAIAALRRLTLLRETVNGG
jgi:hypothetical protein